MPDEIRTNPAENAARRALDEMYACLREKQNFRLEAGAGAGKTYSLVKALRLVIDEKGDEILRKSQQVACITYTNIATDEIISRIDGHHAVQVSTIHSFCWSLIKSFQPFLRCKISEMDKWSEKLVEVGGIGARTIEYDLGYRQITDKIVYLSHDDVIALTVVLMEKSKFRQVLTALYPILFIDEYQDTNKEIADSIIKHFIVPNAGPLIGLFGDSWQKIYQDGSGLIEHQNLKHIGKEANFRSVKTIVDVLNKIRTDLPQEVEDPSSSGTVKVYHTNDWVGTRLSGGHWSGDLPGEIAHRCVKELRENLSAEGWDFAPDVTKILLLTHNALASILNYTHIAEAFAYKESYIKKEDPYIAFLVDIVEPVSEAYQNGLYGKMFTVIGERRECMRNIADKQIWSRDMNRLLKLRETGTIGDVIDLLDATNHPRLPDKVKKIKTDLAHANPEEIEQSLILKQINKLRGIQYTELIALAKYVNDYTPFSTKHGVKGAEYENVLIIFGRGWNQYNWNQFLEWFPDRCPADKVDNYVRNRNLFYVVCSRPKKRLVLLFTQFLSPTALSTLELWFGEANVKPYVFE